MSNNTLRKIKTKQTTVMLDKARPGCIIYFICCANSNCEFEGVVYVGILHRCRHTRN